MVKLNGLILGPALIGLWYRADLSDSRGFNPQETFKIQGLIKKSAPFDC